MSLIAPPDPDWPVAAQAEADRWRASGIAGLIAIHHIGSTSVPGLPAKPIIDLLPVFASETDADAARPAAEAMGYDWRGPNGIAGRRYMRRDDPQTGTRLVHAHGFAQGHPAIRQHLALRDALRASRPLRAAYASVKGHCAARHPDGGPDYQSCKSPWIEKATARALETYA